MKPLILCAVPVLLLVPFQSASASGVLIPRDGSPPIHVRSHRVTAVVDDGLARTTLRQTFVNPYKRMLEAVYLFPLPEGASLVDLAMEVGGQRLEGFLAERRAARRTYDHLVRQRKDPALVEQIGRNTFRLSVFPVMPEEPTVIELTWIQPVPLIQGEYRYIYPLALGSEATTTEQDLTVTVTMRSSAPITSVSSPVEEMLTTRVSAHEARASMERVAARLAEDIVVVARVKTPEPSLDVHVYRPEHGDAYFAAIVTPPELLDDQVIPRDVTLVLDISGSMKGGKFEQARRAGLWLLDHLRERDRVNVILFNSTIESFADEPVLATKRNRRRLRRFLDAASPGGGTALGDALRRACETSKESGRATMAVFLTDGLPTVGETHPEKIIEFAREGAERGLRVFTFGVGQDVGGALLEGIASCAGGRAELFRPDGEIESRLVRFLNRTSSPAIVDLKVTLSGRRVDDLLPRPLEDIYLGEQAVITGRVRGHTKKTLAVRGILDGEAIELRAPIDLASLRRGKNRGETVARDLYAKAKLAFLEQALRLRGGLSDAAYFAALDQGRYSTENELVSALIDLSLETGVQCAYTAFIALLPEDRARLDPRDATALEEALEKARKRRLQVAGLDADETSAPGPLGSSKSPAKREAHGGRAYRGPGDVTPPVAGRGATAPPPGGPVVPGGGAARPRGARTGGFSRRGSGAGFEQWEFWWEYNKEAYVDLGSDSAGRKIPLEKVKTTLLPVLIDALGETDANVVDSAVLTIARILPASEGTLAFDPIVATLGHPRVSARQAATLALGVLGDKRARPILRDILGDTTEGRRLMHRQPLAGGPIPEMMRGLAAISLGLIHDPDDIEVLRQAIDTAPSSARDLPSCALIALGMFHKRQQEIICYLLDVIDREGMNRFNRSLAPIALARLDRAKARVAGLSALLSRLQAKTTDNHTLRSTVIALGKLATLSDKAVIDGLLAIIDYHADAQARHFAIIALGEIAARESETYDQQASVHERIEKRLLDELTQPRRPTHQPWAALALGITVRATRSDPARQELVTAAREALQHALRRSRNPSYQGAMAIALGLMKAREAAPFLIDILDRSLNDALRGSIAVSLGLMNEHAAADRLCDLMQKKEPDWRFRHNLARGLGLLRDTRSIAPLIKCLDRSTTVAEAASIAQAIGMIGDPSAMAPLVRIVADTSRSGQLRGFCTMALGLLSQKTTQPWNAAISIGLNYRSKCDALAEILDIL